MSMFLRVLGILSLAGGVLGAIGTVGVAPSAAVSAFASGVALCVALWWMAEMLSAAQRAATAVERLVAKADIAERR